MTERDSDFSEVDDILSNKGCSTTKAMGKIVSILNKVKYSSIGKVKIKQTMGQDNLISCESNEEILEAQRIEIERQFKHISEVKHLKGNAAAVFDVLNDIRGIWKRSPELVAMKDPQTGDLILSSEQLKTAALDYCHNFQTIFEAD